ncbi:biotin transporter BioY [Schumannella sp. 10F1B-5-1]|uniref:biotin transporter BioY n=1 Tax=Schumannella sp. 10F1B-5-1 TaxID=2590780 RepID=UPI0011317DB3|nr:biotin transporter BioY [Schumannella sp. 10F1B-5-1]TPW70964.1 biotin transporter BioY [Schumannella sp. 10F1B-5-1]
MSFAVSRRLVLADRLIGRSLLGDIGLVAGGVLFTAVLAQVSIELPIVPITGQTLAVLLVGATLGAARGALSMIVYAAAGAAGLPVFSGLSSGVHVLLGTTGGFIVSYVVSAAFVGWLSEQAWDRRRVTAMLTFLGGTVVTFAIGVPWLYASLTRLGPEVWRAEGYDSALAAAFGLGLLPFIPGGIIKAGLAAVLIPLCWRGADALEARRERRRSAAASAPVG